MKRLKSHFGWYTKNQRRGILFLLSAIVIVQVVYFAFDFSLENEVEIKSQELIVFQKQIDSLKIVALQKKQSKNFSFNPNFISDFKGYKLGMSIQEIDRLHQFRKENKWINSSKEFQKVTQVSDSLLFKISPMFKFPEWVTKKNESKKETKQQVFLQKFPPKKDIQISTNDINKATAQDFKTISGIGEKLSERIIKFRTKLQGFTYDYQLYEVWGLNKETVFKIFNKFKITKKPKIKKVNVNTASFKEVLRTPYVDYELCKKIFDYRDEVAELQNINELKNIVGFPLNKYDRIVIYLRID